MLSRSVESGKKLCKRNRTKIFLVLDFLGIFAVVKL